MYSEEFSKIYATIREPKIEMHEGTECYLDPIREKYVPATPEELVRQKTLIYLLEKLHVPKNQLEVEFRLSKAGIVTEEQSHRADIVIFENNIALCVIECKAPNVPLTDETIDQAIGYANSLEVQYVTVVNGIESISYIYMEETNTYDPIKKLPVYREMKQNVFEKEKVTASKKRFTFAELEKNKYYYLNTYQVFSYGTTVRDLPFMTNLFECLIFDDHKMPAKKYRYYTLVEDYGVRNLKVGNSSGGSYAGEYRSFRIEKEGNIFFMNLSIFDYGTENHTILTVSVDRKGKSHNSLQYAFKDANVLGDAYKFIHSGRITIGKYGSGKPTELKEYISKKAPFLLRNGKIDLGVLHNNRLLHMDDAEMITFIDNLLTYALIREEFRDLVEARKKAEEKVK